MGDCLTNHDPAIDDGRFVARARLALAVGTRGRERGTTSRARRVGGRADRSTRFDARVESDARERATRVEAIDIQDRV